MATNRQIVFISSSNELSNVSNLINLTYVGRCLNLSSTTTELDVSTFTGDFIICNALDNAQMIKLKYLNLDNYIKVAVLRKSESSKSEWVNSNLRFDFIVKIVQLVELAGVKTRADVYNTLKMLDFNKKRPVSNFLFIIGKIKSFIPLASFIFQKFSKKSTYIL